MSRDPIDNADEPPEVDIHDPDKQLPPADAAAERVLEYVGWFGSGLIMDKGSDLAIVLGDNMPPLYSRDLEAVAKAAQQGLAALAIHNANGLRWTGGPPRATHQEPYCTECNQAAPCPTVAAARRATE